MVTAVVLIQTSVDRMMACREGCHSLQTDRHHGECDVSVHAALTVQA